MEDVSRQASRVVGPLRSGRKGDSGRTVGADVEIKEEPYTRRCEARE